MRTRILIWLRVKTGVLGEKKAQTALVRGLVKQLPKEVERYHQVSVVCSLCDT